MANDWNKVREKVAEAEPVSDFKGKLESAWLSASDGNSERIGKDRPRIVWMHSSSTGGLEWDQAVPNESLGASG